MEVVQDQKVFLDDKYFKNLVTIHLKNPHEILPYNQMAQDVFGKLMGQRIRSYNGNYKVCYPFGTEDFFADHILTCVKIDGDLIPLTSMKIVTLNQCQRYNAIFPLMHTLESTTEEFRDSVQKFIDECNQVGVVGYIGCRTINPQFKYDRRIWNYLCDSVSLHVVEGCKDLGITDVLITSTIPNGAYKHHLQLGFQNITEQKIIIRDLDNTESYLQHLSKWSEATLKKSETHKKIWDNRVELSLEMQEFKKTAA